MTRTRPDPVFAEGARGELERRAGVELERRGRRSAERRALQPARRDLVQLVAAAAVGVVILGVVLGLDHMRSRLSAALPPRAVASAGPSVRATSAPRPSASLIVPEGFQRRSDSELRSWGSTLPSNVGVSRSVWVAQQIIIVHCMAGKGFLFDPEYRYEHAMDTPPLGHEQAYEEALTGRESGAPYDWRNAGCTGLAEHDTDQDAH